MDTDIIVVKQLPVIAERLQTIKADVTKRVDDALSLECTDETVKEVKEKRAELTKEYKFWEEKRKEVKRAVLSPYDQFEQIYKDCITDVFKSADKELKGKIDAVENELKNQKRQEVVDYFNEYLASKDIDFVTFEQANISVTLSASKKSLKERAKSFVDRICDDLRLIETQEHNTEILVEYKRTLNASAAITNVVNRYKAIEAEKAREAERRKREQAAIEAENKVDEIISEPEDIENNQPLAPPTVDESDPVLTLSFNVTAQKSKLKALKSFLIENNYEFE